MAHLLLHVAQNNQHKLPKPRMFRDRTQPLDCLDDDELMIKILVALRYFATGSFSELTVR